MTYEIVQGDLPDPTDPSDAHRIPRFFDRRWHVLDGNGIEVANFTAQGEAVAHVAQLEIDPDAPSPERGWRWNGEEMVEHKSR